MYQASFIEILFCFVIWIVAMLMYLPAFKGANKSLLGKTKSNKKQLFVLFSFITLYSVFEFAGGDFFHYKEFYEIIHVQGADDGLDPIYLWLIDIIPNNFYLWRLVIWGSAAIIWVQTIKYLGQNVRLAGGLFFLVVFFLFVGARQALGFSLIYLGMSMMLAPKRRVDRLIGFLFFVSAYFFHSTMIVYMLLSLVIFIPFSKNLILASILLFPFIYKSFDLISGTFILQLSEFNENSADRISQYMDSDFRAVRNFNGIIRSTIDRFPIFLLLVISIRDVFWRKIRLEKIYKYFLVMTFLLIYISYLFIGREVSAYIAPRFWDAALFPLTLFLGGYLSSIKITKPIYIAVTFLIISKVFTYLYAFYIM